MFVMLLACLLVEAFALVFVFFAFYVYVCLRCRVLLSFLYGFPLSCLSACVLFMLLFACLVLGLMVGVCALVIVS